MSYFFFGFYGICGLLLFFHFLGITDHVSENTPINALILKDLATNHSKKMKIEPDGSLFFFL